MEREEFLKQHEDDELTRLDEVFKNMEECTREANKALISQAARIKALCDWLWIDIQAHGTTELFQQSDKVPPYERERSSAKHYATYSKLYSSIVKQLIDCLPKEEQKSARDSVDLKGMIG